MSDHDDLNDRKIDLTQVLGPNVVRKLKQAVQEAAHTPFGVQASAGTHDTFGAYLYDSSKAEERARKKLQEEAAQRLLMQVLSWCVVRLGGEVRIPRSVLEGVTYYIEQESDAMGGVVIRASENNTEVTEDVEQDEADPWS